jgi:hypothetical protein
MFKRFSFWLWMTVVFQFLSGISLLSKPVPQGDTEKQLTDLIQHSHMNDGFGFSRTYTTLFVAVSTCFMVLCLFAGSLNIYLWKKKIPLNIMKGVMGINAVFFGACFVIMLLFAFFLPVLCTGLVFISTLAAYFTAKERW